jgi:NADH-quinone oxidoreductase subunit B
VIDPSAIDPGVIDPGAIGPRSYRVATVPGLRVAVLSLGLACCALEIESAVRLGLLVPERATDAPVDRTVLLVSGTVTEPLGPAVVAAVAALAPPVAIVAFGVCASTGGPYWDAPTVIPGADHLVPVSAYVPGCPPRPDALIDALLATEAVA